MVKRATKFELDPEPLKFRIGSLRLEPGDVLVLRTELLLDKDQCNALRERAQEFCPGHKVMIITGGMQLGVLRGLEVAEKLEMMQEDNLGS